MKLSDIDPKYREQLRQRSPKYPWQKWFEQAEKKAGKSPRRPVILTYGKHFHIEPQSMRMYLYRWARETNVSISIWLSKDGSEVHLYWNNE